MDIHGVRSVDDKANLIHQLYGKKNVKKVRRVPDMNHPLKGKAKIRMLDVEGESISLGIKHIKESLPLLPQIGKVRGGIIKGVGLGGGGDKADSAGEEEERAEETAERAVAVILKYFESRTALILYFISN